MRIGVMAAGAVGGYFGARMAAADHDVILFARGAQLDALRRNGLTVESPLGNIHLANVSATDDPKSVAPVDIVLFAVKLWGTEAAGEQIRPIVGPATRVITLQNGVDSVERLAPILGADHVAGGIAYIATVVSAPGVVSHTSQFAQLRCGMADGRAEPALDAFAAAAKAAGIDIAVSTNIERDRWEKFIFLVGLSGATATTRMPLGTIMADADTREFLRTLMQETFAVGRAKGVPIPDTFVAERMAFAANAPKTMKASMLHDLEANRPLELDWLAGRIVALGRELGVATPANAAVYAALMPHREGKR